MFRVINDGSKKKIETKILRYKNKTFFKIYNKTEKHFILLLMRFSILEMLQDRNYIFVLKGLQPI